MRRCLKNWTPRLIQMLIFTLVLRPFISIFMGLTVKNKAGLPRHGPAIIIANHNSHLDTLSLMAQMPLAELWNARPVAAADHFKKGFKGFVARFVLRSILIDREGHLGAAALNPILSALDESQIVIFFPEGSRGEPEILSHFKRGISYLAEARPDVPIIPVYLHNMGKSLPKGSMIFVPFACQMIVADKADLSHVPIEDVPAYLRQGLEALSMQCALNKWDVESGHGLGDRPMSAV